MIVQWLVLLVLLFLVFFPGIGSLKPPRTIASRYIRAVHPYSGLDPVMWDRFKTNIQVFEDEEDVAVAAKALYLATENIRDIGLSIRRADDSHIQEELDDLASRLGVEGEYELYTSAKKKGFYFFPRYLNEMNEDGIDAPTGEEALRRGGTVGDPGTHFPAPRSGTGGKPGGYADSFWPSSEGAGAVRAG
jgi:hypothetical protein